MTCPATIITIGPDLVFPTNPDTYEFQTTIPKSRLVNKTGKYSTLVAKRVPDLKFLSTSYIDADEPIAVIDIHAVGLNHRDLFIRQGLYPNISDQVAMCSDAAGVVRRIERNGKVEKNRSADKWIGKKVVIVPGFGWKDRRSGPEEEVYSIIGGTDSAPVHGTLATTVRMPVSQLVKAPAHLTSAETASLPVAGLTAWRAVVTKLDDIRDEAVEEGRKCRVLITGAGGGVAVFAIQFAVGQDDEVWVTSSCEEKIESAVSHGAVGGIDYLDAGWEDRLLEKSGKFDAIIDSSADKSVVRAASKLVRNGGVVVQYGMTVPPHTITWNMNPILRNMELRGCTMGSAEEFEDMVTFVAKTGIRPVLDRVASMGSPMGCDEEEVGYWLGKGIRVIDNMFTRMARGVQRGNLAVQVRHSEDWRHHDESRL